MWQKFVLDDWLGRSSGRWASLTCGLAVPRQNGKNALLEMRELFGAVGLGERILHTAHEVKTAQKHFRRLRHFFGTRADDPSARYPELNALVEQIRSVNGQEAVLLKNGGSIEIVARSKNSGRGFTVDVLVMDEAQEMAEDALEALMPTTAAAPLGNPQWIFTGTPPGPQALGGVFTRVRDEAMGGAAKSLSWHEWSPPDGEIDLDDRALWRATNPAVTAGRLQEAVIEGERARFSSGGFARERLGKWPTIAGTSRLITEEQWEAVGVDEPPADGIPCFGVAFSVDGTRVSVGAALKREKPHVELVDAAQGLDFALEGGVAPLADWLAEPARVGRTALIVMSGRDGSPALFDALQARGVPKRMMRVASTADYFAACSMFHDAVKSRTVTRLDSDGQAVLDASVAISDKKMRGTSGGWGWEATSPEGDETPVEAVSLALWAAKTTKRDPGRRQVLL